MRSWVILGLGALACGSSSTSPGTTRDGGVTVGATACTFTASGPATSSQTCIAGAGGSTAGDAIEITTRETPGALLVQIQCSVAYPLTATTYRYEGRAAASGCSAFIQTVLADGGDGPSWGAGSEQGGGTFAIMLSSVTPAANGTYQISGTFAGSIDELPSGGTPLSISGSF